MAETSSSAAAVKTVVTEEQTQKILAVRKLILERDEARKSSNFAKSDSLRDQLVGLGVNLIDQTGGPSGWKFKDGSSKKLPSNVVMPEEAKRKRQPEEEEPQSNQSKKKKNEEIKPKSPKSKEPISKSLRTYVICHMSYYYYNALNLTHILRPDSATREQKGASR
jgi:hypothetical protein